jgi:hypothetical protein
MITVLPVALTVFAVNFDNYIMAIADFYTRCSNTIHCKLSLNVNICKHISSTGDGDDGNGDSNSIGNGIHCTRSSYTSK